MNKRRILEENKHKLGAILGSCASAKQKEQAFSFVKISWKLVAKLGDKGDY